MGFKVYFSSELKAVCIDYEGLLDLEDYKKAASQAALLMKDNNSKLFLIDCSNLSNNATIMDMTELPKIYESLGISRNNYSAYIMAHDSPYKRDFSFYETYCTNRGFPLKWFTDRGEAVEWLKSLSKK